VVRDGVTTAGGRVEVGNVMTTTNAQPKILDPTVPKPTIPKQA
jgi:hypothetical protein